MSSTRLNSICRTRPSARATPELLPASSARRARFSLARKSSSDRALEQYREARAIGASQSRSTTWMLRSLTVRTPKVSGPLSLWFRLQLGVVFLDERPNLVSHREELRPLLLVEGDRKAPEPVDGDASLLADFQAGAPPALGFQPLVFRLESFQFGLEIVVGHLCSSSSVATDNIEMSTIRTLAILATHVNGGADSRKCDHITTDMVKRELAGGDIVGFLERELGVDVDGRRLTDVERHKLANVWRMRADVAPR